MVADWDNDASPQTILQWRRMIWMREYRKKIKENEIIYIKKIVLLKKKVLL